jgi:hypothetical protein
MARSTLCIGTPVTLTRHGASLPKNSKYLGMIGTLVGYTIWIPEDGYMVEWPDGTIWQCHTRNEVVWTGGPNANPVAIRGA